MAEDRAHNKARQPKLEDVRAAWFSGKVTAEEANDLSGTKDFGQPDKATDFELDHNAYYTHKR